MSPFSTRSPSTTRNSVIFPLFPSLLDHYLALEGTDSLLGRLVETLSDIASGNRFAVVVLFGGILGSLYSLLQFLFSPFWGSLSDRHGRRPILLLTIAGTAISYLVWIFSGSFLLLLISRVIGGIMSGNIATATAAMADSTTRANRAKGMGIIGEKFKRNEVYVPEVLIAARAMNAAMVVLKPALMAAGVEPLGTAVIGTVKGDLHDIGKNLVGMMFEGAGFRVIDAGIDVAPEKFIELAIENNADVIGVSALLTTTMTNMKLVVEAVKASDLGDKTKIIIGGAPVTQAFCDEIGADGYSPDAASAADLAKSLLP